MSSETQTIEESIISPQTQEVISWKIYELTQGMQDCIQWFQSLAQWYDTKFLFEESDGKKWIFGKDYGKVVINGHTIGIKDSKQENTALTLLSENHRKRIGNTIWKMMMNLYTRQQQSSNTVIQQFQIRNLHAQVIALITHIQKIAQIPWLEKSTQRNIVAIYTKHIKSHIIDQLEQKSSADASKIKYDQLERQYQLINTWSTQDQTDSKKQYIRSHIFAYQTPRSAMWDHFPEIDQANDPITIQDYSDHTTDIPPTYQIKYTYQWIKHTILLDQQWVWTNTTDNHLVWAKLYRMQYQDGALIHIDVWQEMNKALVWPNTNYNIVSIKNQWNNQYTASITYANTISDSQKQETVSFDDIPISYNPPTLPINANPNDKNQYDLTKINQPAIQVWTQWTIYQLTSNTKGELDMINITDLIKSKIQCATGTWLQLSHIWYQTPNFTINIKHSSWIVLTWILSADMKTLTFDQNQNPELPYASFCLADDCYQIRRKSNDILEITKADITWLQIQQWLQNSIDLHTNQSLQQFFEQADETTLYRMESILRYCIRTIGSDKVSIPSQLSSTSTQYRTQLLDSYTNMLKFYWYQKSLTTTHLHTIVKSIASYQPYLTASFDARIHRNIISQPTKRNQYKTERKTKFDQAVTLFVDTNQITDQKTLHYLTYYVRPQIFWQLVQQQSEVLISQKYISAYVSDIIINKNTDNHYTYSIQINNSVIKKNIQPSQKNQYPSCINWTCVIPLNADNIPPPSSLFQYNKQ
jgi:hypothetical protein